MNTFTLFLILVVCLGVAFYVLWVMCTVDVMEFVEDEEIEEPRPLYRPLRDRPSDTMLDSSTGLVIPDSDRDAPGEK